MFARSSAVLSAAALVLAACGDSGTLPETSDPPDAPTSWDAALVVTPTTSSTRLDVIWEPAPDGVEHLRLVATPDTLGPPVELELPATATAHTLDELRSATTYTVTATACLDATCDGDAALDGGSADGTTPEEVWELRASGDGIANVDPLTDDLNVKIHAIAPPADAPTSIAGRVQLYYGPMGKEVKGVSVALGQQPAVTDHPDSVATFDPLTGSAGLISPDAPADLIASIATPMAVPVTEALGANVRLYFEALGADGRTRILYIPSADGWVGQDFHAGDPTVCQTADDYAPGGGCEPTIVLGVDGDPVAPSPGLTDVRQFKLGYPTRDDWRWDGAAGTFMWVTVGSAGGCGATNRNSAYARYDGSTWAIQYEPDGCPRLFEDVQSPSPVHLGGARYKVYYGVPSITDGKAPGGLPFLGPKRVLYADGALTGAPRRRRLRGLRADH